VLNVDLEPACSPMKLILRLFVLCYDHEDGNQLKHCEIMKRLACI
jgi:hypothetical protein